MAVQNSLANRNNQRLGITAFLNSEKVLGNIEQALGKVNKQQFITSVISAVNTNPALQECTNQSILAAALLGETLKLSPSPQLGQYYMVPFNDKNKGKVAQFQLGYKGYIQLAIRSGQYKKLNVLAIKEGELIRFNPLEEEIEVKLIEDEEERENAPTVGYYAMFEYTNGFKKAMYWSKKKMEAHALKYSKGYQAKKGYTFWEKDFDGMAYKTMLRQLISKWGIMSIEMASAMDSDMAVINEDGTKDYVENETDVIDITEVASEVVQEQVEGQTSIEKDFPQYMPTEEPMDAQMALFGK